jgi:hypothetical protein
VKMWGSLLELRVLHRNFCAPCADVCNSLWGPCALPACSIQSSAHRHGVGGAAGSEQEQQDPTSRMQPRFNLSRSGIRIQPCPLSRAVIRSQATLPAASRRHLGTPEIYRMQVPASINASHPSFSPSLIVNGRLMGMPPFFHSAVARNVRTAVFSRESYSPVVRKVFRPYDGPKWFDGL